MNGFVFLGSHAGGALSNHAHFALTSSWSRVFCYLSNNMSSYELGRDASMRTLSFLAVLLVTVNCHAEHLPDQTTIQLSAAGGSTPCAGLHTYVGMLSQIPAGTAVNRFNFELLAFENNLTPCRLDPQLWVQYCPEWTLSWGEPRCCYNCSVRLAPGATLTVAPGQADKDYPIGRLSGGVARAFVVFNAVLRCGRSSGQFSASIEFRAVGEIPRPKVKTAKVLDRNQARSEFRERQAKELSRENRLNTNGQLRDSEAARIVV